MSDFPNINNLLKQTQSTTDDQNGSVGADLPITDSGRQLKKKMQEVQIKEKEIETMRFANQIGFPHINLDKFPVSQEALRQVERAEAERLGLVCFYIAQGEVRLGALDPNDEEVQEMSRVIGENTHSSVDIYVISETSLNRVLKLYDNLPHILPIDKNIEITAEDLAQVEANVNDFASLQAELDRRSATDLLVLLLGASLKLDASDLHIEAEEDGIIVRLRLDGILHDAAQLPTDDFKKLINRIKLVSSLKLNISDKPQDGRFSIRLAEGDVDVRVSTLPTVYGESVVMRILHQSKEGLDLDSLGLRGSAYDKLMKEIARPNGMIITTGPTGSGKTTTMYAIIKLLNKPGVKIITLEDPVEYKMPGINQSQVEHSKDYTFAKGLRSILRQDPDIAMVGEIRDLETAEIAIQAALTGHLILSTIHTNKAAGAVPRFLSMGAKPFLLAPALNCVIGQRLVRRICPHCKEEITLLPDEKKRIAEIIQAMPEEERLKVEKRELKFYQGKGCEECNNIGYKGRIGIHEIFVVSQEFESMILHGNISEYEIENKAIEDGMLTMVQDGIIKALDEITSIDEVFRVTE